MTLYFVLAVILLVGIYDFMALAYNQTTISELAWKVSGKRPWGIVIGMILGGLLWHLFVCQ